MNCVPALVLAVVVVVAELAGAWGAAAAAVAVVVVVAELAGAWKPSATAALSLGSALPKPQPPSISWAITGPAHLPVLKPQQPSAQSASLVHGPVMNCVP
jgi:hypothetical protein